jgi:hypothetical protein
MEHRNRLHLLDRDGGREATVFEVAGTTGRRRWLWLSLILPALMAFGLRTEARTLLTQPQALATVFPQGATRQVHYLTPAQLAAAQKEAGVEFSDRMIVRYRGAAGFAYFDTHRVRTLAETVMIVVAPDGRIDRIEVLSFDEPPEYLPKERWLEQFDRRSLDPDLSLKRKIRPLSGASLTARAITNASRKVLALHKVIEGK